jgi:hypothetical protein
MVGKKDYEVKCDCGYRVKKKTLAEARLRFKKHNHKLQIIEWTKVSSYGYDGKIVK